MKDIYKRLLEATIVSTISVAVVALFIRKKSEKEDKQLRENFNNLVNEHVVLLMEKRTLERRLEDLEKKETTPNTNETAKSEENLPDSNRYAQAISSAEESVKNNSEPFSISATALGANESYKLETYILYSDDSSEGLFSEDLHRYLTDDEVEQYLGGWDILDELGEYEEDTLYVQNDVLKTYYTILRAE